MDREKLIKDIERQISEPTNEFVVLWFSEAEYVLAMLKEQQEQIDKLLEESASNAEMAEGLRELLKEQEEQKQKWLQNIADNQLANSPDEWQSPEQRMYSKGVFDGLQMAYEMLAYGVVKKDA